MLALGVTAAGVFLVLHRSPVPAKPITAPVIFPTRMLSAMTGWAVTQRGTSQQVWRTVDGGTTWTDATPHFQADPAVYAYTNYFLNESHAWVTVSVVSRTAGTYVVTYRTADGGKSWQRGSPVSAPLNSMPPVDDFIDANTGWLVLNSLDLAHAAWPDVYATVDGGMHWSLTASHAGAETGTGNLVAGGGEPSFVSPSTGWLTVSLYSPGSNGSFFFAKSIVLATHDGGRTWQAQQLPVEPGAGMVVDPPVFFGQREGIMVMHPMDPASGGKSVLLATSDGGKSWSARTLEWDYIESIQFVDRAHGWAVAGAGSDFMKAPGAVQIPLPLYRTDDGGVSWVKVATSLDLQNGRDRVTDIHFVDQGTGFVTIWNDGGPTQVLRSDDGGRTWRVVEVCRSAVGLTYPPPACPA
jgi:photosystem II stability/assembly factor-like uncharacterized protein